jgi:hypothetical protein
MPNWGEVLQDLKGWENPLDFTRKKYLKILNMYTDRNVIS